jgi:hypothetical protein
VDHQECAILEGLFGLHLFDTISILSLPDRLEMEKSIVFNSTTTLKIVEGTRPPKKRALTYEHHYCLRGNSGLRRAYD